MTRFGEIARRLLTEQEVDLEGIVTTAGAATSYSIVLQSPDRDRTFWHHAGANAAFTGREVNLDGVDILHLGYPPLLPELLADDAAPLLNLLKEARSRQITTSLDLAVVDPRSRAAEVDWRRDLRPDHALRRYRHSEHRRPNVGARHRPERPTTIWSRNVPAVWSTMDAPSPSCRRVREERTRSALALIASLRLGPLSPQSGLRGARQRSGYRRLSRGASSARPERAMPPAPDSSTALHKELASGGQLVSLHGSPRPPSREATLGGGALAAGPPSWPRQASTDQVDVATCDQKLPKRLGSHRPEWRGGAVIDFNHRPVLVTGATGGIGGETVRQLIAAGADADRERTVRGGLELLRS